MLWRKGVVCAAVLIFLVPLPWAQKAPVNEVTVFFTGFVRGNYGPCGCAAGPAGGVSRRAGYSKAFAEDHSGALLHVDAGNYLQPPGPRSEMINRLMLESMQELPLAVMNLGIEDLYWWNTLSGEGVGDTQVISTNLVSEAPGLPQPAKYAVVIIPADQTALGRDLRIGFLGIADPKRVKPNARFRGVDPLEAVAAVKAEVMEKADFLIVLADVSRSRGEIPQVLRQLAEQNSEIIAILVTERRYRLYDPVQINSATILSSVERGRYLGQLTLLLDSSGAVAAVKPDSIELKEGLPEVEALRSKAEWINAQLP